jgi:hypothetical protein
LDGFLEGNGFVMVKSDLRGPLMDLSEMRNTDGKLRFPFLPSAEELSGMSPEEKN